MKRRYAGLVAGGIILLLVFFLRSDISSRWEKEVDAQKTEKIGWITDIHAGKPKKRALTEENIVYPRKFKEYLPKVLDEMEDKGVRTVIVTGDNTNSGEKEYAEQLEDIVENYRMKFLWIRGNHDLLSTDVMSVFKDDDEDDDYYAYDTGKTKIIVMDIDSDGTPVEEEQIEWLRREIGENEKPIIVAMHPPIINFETNEIYLQYEEIEKIISSGSDIRYVISGHLHIENKVVHNGVTYLSANALTLKDHPGSFYILEISNKIDT